MIRGNQVCECGFEGPAKRFRQYDGLCYNCASWVTRWATMCMKGGDSWDNYCDRTERQTYRQRNMEGMVDTRIEKREEKSTPKPKAKVSKKGHAKPLRAAA